MNYRMPISAIPIFTPQTETPLPVLPTAQNTVSKDFS